MTYMKHRLTELRTRRADISYKVSTAQVAQVEDPSRRQQERTRAQQVERKVGQHGRWK